MFARYTSSYIHIDQQHLTEAPVEYGGSTQISSPPIIYSVPS